MAISVILPTYNRAETLRKTLRAYAEQRGDHQMLEIIVVDDGSKDHTSDVVEESRQSSATPIRYFRQENRGQAAARNLGIREARGELILFGDDDIIPSASMVAEHVGAHQRHPAANIGILGLVSWAAELHPTPFMIWCGLYGPQFEFGLLQPGGEVDCWHAYFCNTSVKSEFIRQNGTFNEVFREYGWEDFELSYRVYQRGLRVLYRPEALGYHYKYETLRDTLRRALVNHRTLAVFATTEAGKAYVQRFMPESPQPGKKSIIKELLRPLKRVVMLLLGYLVDTHVRLPNRIYEYVFYDFLGRELSSNRGAPSAPRQAAGRGSQEVSHDKSTIHV
jgi:glycosyltransferase involved in cell wall biosynthesis